MDTTWQFSIKTNLHVFKRVIHIFIILANLIMIFGSVKRNLCSVFTTYFCKKVTLSKSTRIQYWICTSDWTSSCRIYRIEPEGNKGEERNATELSPSCPGTQMQRPWALGMSAVFLQKLQLTATPRVWLCYKYDPWVKK